MVLPFISSSSVPLLVPWKRRWHGSRSSRGEEVEAFVFPPVSNIDVRFEAADEEEEGTKLVALPRLYNALMGREGPTIVAEEGFAAAVVRAARQVRCMNVPLSDMSPQRSRAPQAANTGGSANLAQPPALSHAGSRVLLGGLDMEAIGSRPAAQEHTRACQVGNSALRRPALLTWCHSLDTLLVSSSVVISFFRMLVYSCT